MLKEDFEVSGLSYAKLITGFFSLHPFYLVVLYRFSNWLYKKKVKVIPSVILKGMGKILFSADLSPSAEIGKGFKIVHAPGIVIGGGVEIGEHCTIHQNVTIGANHKEIDGRKLPIIKKNVNIYAGAVLVGPIKVEDNVKVGANSVLVKNAPQNSTVYGNPATIKEG